MQHKIKGYNDCFFRYLLSSKNNEKHALSFINAVLQDQGNAIVKSITIENPFNLKEHYLEKESIVDIRCKDENNKIFHIEIQVMKEKKYENRALYYWAKIYSSLHKKKSSYAATHPVLSIHILNFIHFQKHEEIHSIFKLREIKQNFTLTENMALHFLEMPKLKSIKATSRLLRWLRFFKDADKGDAVMKPIADEDPDIKAAYDEYKDFTDDEAKTYAALRREMFLRDQYSREESARLEGREEGREEERNESIKTLILDRFPSSSQQLIELAIKERIEIVELVKMLNDSLSPEEFALRIDDYSKE